LLKRSHVPPRSDIKTAARKNRHKRKAPQAWTRGGIWFATRMDRRQDVVPKREVAAVTGQNRFPM